ncbi:MAG: flagellar hook-length control protein FliK [Cellvibrionaceae bacterium]
MNNQLMPFADVAATNKIDRAPAKANSTGDDKGFSNSFREAEQQAAVRPESKSETKAVDTPKATNTNGSTNADSVDKPIHAEGKNTKAQTDVSTGQNTEEELVKGVTVDSASVSSELVVPLSTELDPTLSLGVVPVGILPIKQPVSESELLVGEESLLEEPFDTDILVDFTENNQNSDNILPTNPLVNLIREVLAAKPLNNNSEGSAELKKVSPLTALAEAFNAIKQNTQVGGKTTEVATTTQLAMNANPFDSDIPKNSFDGVLDKQLLSLLTDEPILTKTDTITQRMAGDIPLASISNPAQLQMTSPIDKSQLSVTIPFQQAQWSEAVAERVMWMSAKGIQEAEIQLDPPELGPLQVKVSVTNEQTQVSFVVQNASVRDALDQSAMRLREMFEAEGLNLTDVDVSDQSQQQAEDESSNPESNSVFGVSSEEEVDGALPLNSSIEGYSLVNTYV